MVSQQLLDYIKQQTALGKSPEEIKQALINNGWKAEDVEQGFGQANNNTPNVPLPTQTASTQLPKISRLFADSFNLMKERILVMFVSALLPILGVVASGILAFIIWFIISRLNSSAGNIAAVVLIVSLIACLFYSILWGTTSYLVALRDAPEKTGIKENLKRSRPLIWSFLLITLIANLVITGGFLLLIIPGIIFTVWYGFAIFVMVDEGKKGIGALAQSKAYVVGRSWKVFGRICLFYLLYLIPYIILQILASYNKNSPVGITALVLLFILQFFYSFYQITFLFTLYKQLKESSGTTNSEQYKGSATGWLVWGAIAGPIIAIGLMASVVLLALNSARSLSRDSKRLADTRQMASVLELYFNDHDAYPHSMNDLVPKYTLELPVAPTPADGNCTDTQNTYSYTVSPDQNNYSFDFCLGRSTGNYSAGPHILSTYGIDNAVLNNQTQAQ